MLILNESKQYNPFKYDTNTAYYNSLISDKPAHSGANYSEKEYFRFEKNVEGHIEWMTASKYIDECSKIFNGDAGKGVRGSSDIDKYAKAMLNGDKFPLPYINYKSHSQEGRHRMLAAAKAFGENTEFPVLIVTETNATDKEIFDYAKKKYPEDPQFVVNMVNNALHRYKDSDDNDIKLIPQTITAIELELGDIINYEDKLYKIVKFELDNRTGVNIDLIDVTNKSDRYIWLQDDDKIEYYPKDNNPELYKKYEK